MKRNSKLRLYSDFATREKMSLYERLYTTLPDPDKILAENGYDYNIYRDLLTDPHLAAAIQQRKMQVMQMGWEIYYSNQSSEDRNDKEVRIEREGVEIVQNWDLSRIISDVIDAVFFGYAVLEIRWKLKKNLVVPVELVSKPQEWFMFDIDNEPRMRKRMNGNYLFEEGEKLPPYKFVVTQYQPTYTNPYGIKLLSRCYWPITFKRAGIEQWHILSEKFGIPFLLGYYPVGASAEEQEKLLDTMTEMIENNVGVVEEGNSFEFKENPKYEIGQLFQKLAEFHNNEISKAILTVTLTTELGTTGSYKAAETHREMLSYIGVADKKLVERCVNQVLRYYIELNYGQVENYPKLKLKRKEYVIEESEDRDVKLRQMGVKFSRDYYRKRYNLADKDFEIEDSSQKTVGRSQKSVDSSQ